MLFCQRAREGGKGPDRPDVFIGMEVLLTTNLYDLILNIFALPTSLYFFLLPFLSGVPRRHRPRGDLQGNLREILSARK